MNTKVALIGGAVLLQMAAFGGLIWLMAHDNPTARPTIGTTPKFEPRVDVLFGAPQLPLTGAGWRLVDQLSAHYALILEVEAENLPDALAIAQQLTEPIKDSYVEVLVYFYPIGRERGLPARRVQWTLESGYVEMSLQQ